MKHSSAFQRVRATERGSKQWHLRGESDMFRKLITIALTTVACAAPPAWGKIKVGEYFPARIVTPRDYAGSVGGGPEIGWTYRLTHPGATYMAVHFVDFDLGPADYLTISDAFGNNSYTLQGKGKMEAGTFWAQHIKGDTILMELVKVNRDGGRGFLIDEYAAGFVELGPPPEPRAICGVDDKDNAVCYETSHPTEYDRSRAAARLLITGRWLCTGWLASPMNHLITNEHCISTAVEALNTDYEFMAEAPNCSDPNCQLCHPGTVYSGATLIQNDSNLDYCLVQINSGNPAGTYGYLEIDNREAIPGEEVYIPQHPNGRGKELGIYSTYPSDTGGVCQVYSINRPPCGGSGYFDVGYYCDTEGGSSGSPVLARSSHEVIALHHCAYCPNRGVPINLIYPLIEDIIDPCDTSAVSWTSPPNCVLDARRPHPHGDSSQLEGIGGLDEPIIVDAPGAIDTLACWTLEETNQNPGLHPPYPPHLLTNTVDSVICGGGTCTVTLLRPITPGEVTTITYLGDEGNPGEFASLPSDVSADGTSSYPPDVNALIGWLNGNCSLAWDTYSCDVDHSDLCAPADILSVIDLMNGAGEFEPWLNATITLPCSQSCPGSTAPEPDPGVVDEGCGTKNRYLSFAAGDCERQQAIQVTFASLPGYEYAEGRTMWVQEPFAVTELSGLDGPTPPPTFWAAVLGCTPFFTDWSAFGVVDVYDAGIVPSATYELRAIDSDCPLGDPGSYSDPLEVTLSAPGDIVGLSCGDCPCDPTNCIVNFVDVVGVLDKFSNVLCVPVTGQGVPRKAQADITNTNILDPLPDKIVDIMDIVCCLDAFRGAPCLPPGPPIDDPCAPAAKTHGELRSSGVHSVSLAGPVEINLRPSTPVVQPGGLCTVDVFAKSVVSLRAYQLSLDLDDRHKGAITVEDLRIDIHRPDYVFASTDAIATTDNIGKRLGAASMADGITIQGRVYLGTFVLRASSRPTGVFDLELRLDDGSTFLRDSSHASIPFQLEESAPASIKVEASQRSR